MPTCSGRRPQRGFTYLLLLLLVALSAAGLAALAEQVQLSQQREREAELLFRGIGYVNALRSYAAVQVDGVSTFPPALADLVEDRRLQPPVHHLRRLYSDPFTGHADWLPILDAQGRIIGVRSSSSVPALRRTGLPAIAQPPAAADNGGGPRPMSVGDWLFLAVPAVAQEGN